MMAAPAFDATRFIRPALLTIALFFSIIVISSMTMVKPAHASGNVQRTTLWCSHEYNPASCMYSTKEEACIALAADNPLYNYNPKVVYSGGWFVGYRCYGQYVGTTSYYSLGWLIKGGACPSNSTFTSATSCTCNTDFKPDPTATSCMPANNCPANMSGSPCVCIPGGYVPNPNGAGCVEEQYTLTLQNPLADVEPGTPRDVVVRVTNAQTKEPKNGARVSLKVEVEANSGGHDHHDDQRPKGTLTGAACDPQEESCVTATTRTDGYASFTFSAPPVSGKHTFTATCISPVCSGSDTGKINVKVDGLVTIPADPTLYAFVGAVTGKHTDNHYLTGNAFDRLTVLAINYHFLFPNDPVLHLNDASLVWGGVFDFTGRWKPGHKEHRRGTVIDVRANQAIGSVPFNNFKRFNKIAGKAQVDAAVHCTDDLIDHQGRTAPDCIGRDGSQDSNRHYHLRLMGVPE